MIEEIKNSIQITGSNIPLRKTYSGENTAIEREGDAELNLGNPYGKISCLILYLYSMELGQPPLYFEINQVCRSMDVSQLQNLGPYIKALGIVTQLSEQNREHKDKITTGDVIFPKNKYNMAGLFILYRGASMLSKWIAQYKDLAENEQTKFSCVSLSGSSSCTQNLIIALEFAYK